MEFINKLKFLKHIDIFGIPYLFSFNEEDKYKTCFGGIITILSFIIMISILYVLGEEIIYRNNPRDLVTVTNNPIPPNITFSISSGFLFVDDRSSFIENFQKFIRFEAYYNYYINNESGLFKSEVSYPINLSTRKCKYTDFPYETNHQYKIMSLDNAICIDNSEVELAGDFTGNYAKYLSLQIKPCKNNTIDGVICASQEEIIEYFSFGNRSISMHHVSIQYNPSNFTYPIKKYISEDNYKFDIKFCKEITYFIQEMRIITDQGIFWKDIKSSSNQMIDNVKMETYRNNYPRIKFSDICLFDFRFFSSVNMKIHNRDYLKGTDIIAQMGGILKIYLLIGDFIFFFIYNRSMSESIITKLYHISEEDLKIDKTLHSSNNIKKSSQKLIYEKNINILSYNDKNNEEFNKNVNTKNKQEFNDINKNISSIIHLNIQNNCKKNISKNKKRISNIFSYSEYLYITFCLCFVNKGLKEKLIKFNFFKKIASKYTDILKIIKKLNEITKLKYVLLNKKQLAIFNLIDSPFSPLDSNVISKYSEKYKYELNKELQKIKAEEFLSIPISILFRRKIDRRLYKFLCD